MHSRFSISRTARRLVVPVIAAVAVGGAMAGPALADQFSPYVPSGTFQVSDCGVRVGPVADPSVTLGTPGWRVIAGAEVNCNSRHTIGAYVREYASVYSNGYGAWEAGNGASTAFYNSYGFGNRILEANAGCQRGLYVSTWADVDVDGVWSGWRYSPWEYDTNG